MHADQNIRILGAGIKQLGASWANADVAVTCAPAVIELRQNALWKSGANAGITKKRGRRQTVRAAVLRALSDWQILDREGVWRAGVGVQLTDLHIGKRRKTASQ